MDYRTVTMAASRRQMGLTPLEEAMREAGLKGRCILNEEAEYRCTVHCNAADSGPL